MRSCSKLKHIEQLVSTSDRYKVSSTILMNSPNLSTVSSESPGFTFGSIWKKLDLIGRFTNDFSTRRCLTKFILYVGISSRNWLDRLLSRKQDWEICAKISFYLISSDAALISREKSFKKIQIHEILVHFAFPGLLRCNDLPNLIYTISDAIVWWFLCF